MWLSSNQRIRVSPSCRARSAGSHHCSTGATSKRSLRSLAIGYLIAAALGATIWWMVLLACPGSRAYFMASEAPLATLWALAVPDGIFFIGTAIVAAGGFATNCRWARMMLGIHFGAAGYATLYCWGLTIATWGEAWMGPLFMTPAMIAPAMLLMATRPRSER